MPGPLRLYRIAARKWRSYARRPLADKLLFIPAWFLLGLGRALVLFVPFRRLAPRLGTPTGVAPWIPLVDARQGARARQVGRAVRLAARYTPWESNCFPQAIAARVLLGCFGVPYTFFFGLARGDGSGMKAHAWVTAGPVAVTGGQSFRQFTVVGCFAHRAVSPKSFPAR